MENIYVYIIILLSIHKHCYPRLISFEFHITSKFLYPFRSVPFPGDSRARPASALMTASILSLRAASTFFSMYCFPRSSSSLMTKDLFLVFLVLEKCGSQKHYYVLFVWGIIFFSCDLNMK